MNRRFILVAGILALLSGCGGPRFVPVQGTVTLDGKPLAFKSLFFAPESPDLGHGSGGFTDRAGRYYLIAVVHGTVNEFRGVQPGRYRVTLSEPMLPITEADFGPLERQDDSGDPGPAMVMMDRPRTRQPIPQIYAHPETTPLVVEVPDEGGEFNLELNSSQSG